MRRRKLLWGVLAFAPWWGFVLLWVFAWRGAVDPTLAQRGVLIFGNVLGLQPYFRDLTVPALPRLEGTQ